MTYISLIFTNAQGVRLQQGKRDLRGRLPVAKFGPSFIGDWCGNALLF